MQPNIFWYTILSKYRSFAALALGLPLFILISTAFYPSLRLYPDYAVGMQFRLASILSALGVTQPVMTPAGYASFTSFSLLLPLIFSVLTILTVGTAFTQEVERGQMEPFLVRSLTRRQLLKEKAAALASVFALLGLEVWIFYAWRASALGMDLRLFHLFQALFASLLLALWFGSLAFVFGAVTGKTSLSIILSLGGLGISILIFLISHLSPAFQLLQYLSPFYYALGNDPTANGLNFLALLFLIATGSALMVYAFQAFDRLDLVEYQGT